MPHVTVAVKLIKNCFIFVGEYLVLYILYLPNHPTQWVQAYYSR